MNAQTFLTSFTIYKILLHGNCCKLLNKCYAEKEKKHWELAWPVLLESFAAERELKNQKEIAQLVIYATMGLQLVDPPKTTVLEVFF